MASCPATVRPLNASNSVFADLDPHQWSAVEATDGPVLLIAGPGASKTLTLVRRTLRGAVAVHASGPAIFKPKALASFAELVTLIEERRSVVDTGSGSDPR